MKSKTIPLILVTIFMALIWCSSAWADSLNNRGFRQTERIRRGFRSGEITRPEVRRLKNEQRHIDRAYHRALADGRLNRQERRRLAKMQDHASRDIYLAKHNHFRRRHTVVHRHNANCYYPVPKSVDAGGYGFSVGLSDIGWRFAFSGWGR